MVSNQHVIIISAQPIPNLIPVILHKPCRVHLLVSPQMKHQALRIKAFLDGQGVGNAEYAIDPYNMNDVEKVCEKIIAATPSGGISLNVTGGTKVAAFGAFAAFSRHSLPVFYFDPAKWQIVPLDTSGGVPITPTAEISVADYLAVYGKKVFKVADDDEVLAGRRDITAWLAEYFPSSGLMPILNAFAAEAIQGNKFPFSKSFDKKWFNHKFTPILKKLSDERILAFDPKTKTVKFATTDQASYIGGFWLEEYVYNVVKSLGVHDVKRNVNIKWDEKGITNEFDVVFTNRCRLFIISCKTSKLASEKQYKDKNPVYELDSLRDDAAGLFGKGILVSVSPLGNELQKRADTLGIVTIDSENAGKWLKKKLQIEINW